MTTFKIGTLMFSLGVLVVIFVWWGGGGEGTKSFYLIKKSMEESIHYTHPLRTHRPRFYIPNTRIQIRNYPPRKQRRELQNKTRLCENVSLKK